MGVLAARCSRRRRARTRGSAWCHASAFTRSVTRCLDDGVLLQSVANGLFLHRDAKARPGSLEVNGAAMGSPFTLTLFRSAAEAHAGELRAGLVRMRSARTQVQTDLEHANAVAALGDAADHDGAGAGTAAANAAVVTVEAGVPLVDELRAVVGPQPATRLSLLFSPSTAATSAPLRARGRRRRRHGR